MGDPVAVLLGRSLTHVATETPEAYRRLVQELSGLLVEIDVDGERFAVRGGASVEIVPAVDHPDVRIGTSRGAILAVLDADVSLAEAVESGQVDVRGSLGDVVRAHDAVLAYAHAAVRAPSVPGLLADLR